MTTLIEPATDARRDLETIIGELMSDLLSYLARRLDDPHDAGELAAALTRMLDPAYRAAAQQAARQTGNRWTFESHYRAILDVFAEVRRAKRAA